MRSPDEPGLAAVAPSLSITKRFIIAAASAIDDATCRSDGTVNRRLVSLLDARSSAKPVQGARTVDTLPRRGFAFLSPASYLYDHVCRRLCRTVNAIVVSVNYRLAPEHRYPAPYEDGVDVLRFLDRGGLLYADPLAADLADLSRCFLVGDSAGANICHHVARRWAAGAGMVLIQPYFGGEERTDAEVRRLEEVTEKGEGPCNAILVLLPDLFQQPELMVNNDLRFMRTSQ
ncbi:hypothetical protein OPV22_031307 [Ensete ventricosum]|uniref:Alpha/beta hydrolase fold-3 domain-containing protein n=1 Tax=Ensete ventricosum TaxID=4639 RepID=A0AAV8NZ80_ENSVE|nr:hypothetical protein OPV22_031307 [Ensete ventricosum]